MEIRASARTHGIADADILQAWAHALRVVSQEYDHETRLLVLGPARDGALLELVATPRPTAPHRPRRPDATEVPRPPQVIP